MSFPDDYSFMLPLLEFKTKIDLLFIEKDCKNLIFALFYTDWRPDIFIKDFIERIYIL